MTLTDGVTIRKPELEDGQGMWRLARDSGGLEVNSPYSYVMACRHFRDTSVVAELHGDLVGFVSAHIPHTVPDAIFVWQITTAPSQRGKGLGLLMLTSVVGLDGCEGVRFLEATVTPSNEASQRMFRGLARHLKVPCKEGLLFPRHLFPGVEHEDEDLFRIGPFR